MEPVFGFIIYLVFLIVVVAIAASRKLAWWAFLLITPIASVLVVMFFGRLEGGMVGAIAGFVVLGLSLLVALTMKSQRQKIADGDVVAGYKKCPFCAESIRAEAIKCKHCGSDLSDEEKDTEIRPDNALGAEG